MSVSVSPSTRTSAPAGIDPRGPRFGAAITTVVLAAAFLLIPVAPVLAGAVLAGQALAFGLATVIGLHAQPYSVIYRLLVRPRLAPPSELEDPRPPRFAQAVGLAFVIAALILLILGADSAAQIAVGAALAAALLNAAFGLCLGCEAYLLIVRARGVLKTAR
jgi:hypothetical protein